MKVKTNTIFYVSCSKHVGQKLHIADRIGDGQSVYCGRRMSQGWKWTSRKFKGVSVCKSCAARGA